MIKYRIRSVERTGNGLNQVKTKCSVVKVPYRVSVLYLGLLFYLINGWNNNYLTIELPVMVVNL